MIGGDLDHHLDKGILNGFFPHYSRKYTGDINLGQFYSVFTIFCHFST